MISHSTRLILAVCIALIASVAIFELTTLDLVVQNFLYESQGHKWLIDRDSAWLKRLLYDGIKQIYIALTLIVLGVAAGNPSWPPIGSRRHEILVVAAALVLIPLVANGLKAVTNIPCPKDLALYGGNYPHVTLFTAYPSDFIQVERIRCYPAGHASGGFALMALALLAGSGRRQLTIASAACGLGWVVGFYKMGIGDHFLGHTVVTMLLAMLLILLLDRVIPSRSP